jgi:xanthine dehydrogenase accessory factor
VVIKGGGDLGSGVAHSLHRAGMRVAIAELPQPLVIRRTVSYANAIYEGIATVEAATARLAHSASEVSAIWERGDIAVIADPHAEIARELRPDVVVDATLSKRAKHTRIDEAPLVIALGPGFIASQHAHAVIETMRGHNLGRVITEGSALPDTKTPGEIAGYSWARLLRAPADGEFQPTVEIGDHVERGEIVAHAASTPLRAGISGVVRGMLRAGLGVREGAKVGDIDPRDVRENCFTISDKSRAIGRAVLEAILWLCREP